MNNQLRVCVLISGGGTNLQALIDQRDTGVLSIEIVLVISNNPEAAGLQRAAKAGITCKVIDHKLFDDRNDFDLALAAEINQVKPDLLVLAGFMRILGPGALSDIHCNAINLHPSLLPLYQGTQTYQRALDAGDSEHGASIHFVTAELDGGPVISQVRIPVLSGDDSNSLAARLGTQEHQLITATVELFCRRQVSFRQAGVTIDGRLIHNPLQLNSDGSLGQR
jgi:phosphoribosylglycinamide formyltransferase-1